MLKRYLFRFGDAVQDPLYGSAEIKANNTDEAITLIRNAVESPTGWGTGTTDRHIGWIVTHFNTYAISKKNIVSIDDIDLCSECQEPLGAGGDGYFMLCATHLEEYLKAHPEEETGCE